MLYSISKINAFKNVSSINPLINGVLKTNLNY